MEVTSVYAVAMATYPAIVDGSLALDIPDVLKMIIARFGGLSQQLLSVPIEGAGLDL